MRIITWNVNGLRACLNKGFKEFFEERDADCFCLQETKLQPHQLELDLPGYEQYLHSAVRKGYSGTAIFTKQVPMSVTYDFGLDKFNDEGRVITMEFESFYLVNAYVPNSKDQLTRLEERMEWEACLRNHLKQLDAKKPVIYCGDLNVAHEEIDLKNPKANRMNPGFSDEERQAFTLLLEEGFKDTYRTLYPDKVAYSWCSYRFNARKNNAGWRIDYFVVSERIMDKVKEVIIHTQQEGSDHCPVEISINI